MSSRKPTTGAWVEYSSRARYCPFGVSPKISKNDSASLRRLKREFEEDLVESGFLSAAFHKIAPRYLYTVWRPLTYSLYSEATELMMYQVYDLRLTTANAQEAELRTLQQQSVKELRWVTEAQIKRVGDDQLALSDPFRIGQHACYFLPPTG